MRHSSVRLDSPSIDINVTECLINLPSFHALKFSEALEENDLRFVSWVLFHLPEHSGYREDGIIAFRGNRDQHQRRPLEIVKTRKIKIFDLWLSCSDFTYIDSVFHFDSSECWVHSDSETVIKPNPRNFCQDVGALDRNVNIVYRQAYSIFIVYFLAV